MRTVILAGGRGTRLSPYTTVLPKPLMPIGDVAVLEILVRRLAAHDIRDITLAVGYLAELLRSFCRDGAQWGVRIDYSREDEPLGTAGPLALLPPSDEPVLVLNGDLLTDLDFTGFLSHHRAAGATATIGIYERAVRLGLGVVEVSSSGEVADYVEKPTFTYLVSMGAYVITPKALAQIPRHQRFDLPDLIRALVAAGDPVATYLHKGYWVDIGEMEDYRRATEDFPSMKDRFLGRG
jgi:NDP-mannose synthase